MFNRLKEKGSSFKMDIHEFKQSPAQNSRHKKVNQSSVCLSVLSK